MRFTLLIMLFLFPVVNSYACSCIPLPPFSELLAKSDNAFVVVVTEVEYLGTEGKFKQGNQRAKFKVLDIFKGDPSKYPYIWSGVNFPKYDESEYINSSCDSFGILAGASYAIFAKEDETLLAHMCSKTVLRISDIDTIAKLKQLAK